MTDRNPFGVYNPEQLDAEYIARNFVDMYTDVPRLWENCNTFILGARGTGKSMLLRSLEPEVMLRAGRAETVAHLPRLAVHVPLKKAEFAVPELNRLMGYASIALGEHLLAVHVMFRLARTLVGLAEHVSSEDARRFVCRFDELLAISEGKLPTGSRKHHRLDSRSAFEHVQRICERETMRTRQYFIRVPFSRRARQYTGPLTGFLDFVVPLTEVIGRLDGLPRSPVFLMLDDADNLPITIQKVLNSWVSTRSTHCVCLKITTQLGYATFRTVDNRIIESPHDFDEVNLGTVYTTDHERYSKRVHEIVVKRLHNHEINEVPEQFFPRDGTQDNRIKEIENEIRLEWNERQLNPDAPRRGASRSRDEVIRYAIPRFMRELAGTARSSHTYSYAGFKALVDLSSGVVRWFLEPASRMYDRVRETGTSVRAIPVGVQDDVVDDWSREFISRLVYRHDASQDALPPSSDIEPDPDASLHALGHETKMYERLKNLIDGLGRLFRERLLDADASEQRLFSIVVRGPVPDELQQVLGLGVRLGYLQTSDNAAKEALGGRLARYVLARRLGPYYRLDVSGYAAHLSVTGQDLAVAMRNPDQFVGRRLDRRSDPGQFSFELEMRDADVPQDQD